MDKKFNTEASREIRQWINLIGSFLGSSGLLYLILKQVGYDVSKIPNNNKHIR